MQCQGRVARQMVERAFSRSTYTTKRGRTHSERLGIADITQAHSSLLVLAGAHA